jgi:hypothetical protein
MADELLSHWFALYKTTEGGACNSGLLTL